MAAAELNAIVNIVGKVFTFATNVQAQYYKGSAEVAAFKSKGNIFRAKHAQWKEELRRFGTDELITNGLSDLAKDAGSILEEHNRDIQKLKEKRFDRWKKVAFPTQLTNLLDRLEVIVDAGPKLLQAKVHNHDLLERNLGQSAASLPFGNDERYVPIEETVQDVQNALEHERVVTIFGGPGLGKTGLGKYLALKNQEERKQFRDGVQYLFCGRQKTIKDLLQHLLECLGSGASSEASPNESSVEALRRELIKRLANQNVLLVLDDLWEREVFSDVLVPAPGVKYLITSQNKEIWADAKKIPLRNPNNSEASKIMANHTQGLPTKGELPGSIRDVADAIMRKVDNHPLSLANIAISVDDSEATDASYWKTKSDHLHAVLEDNDLYGNPVVFDTVYKLNVKASMMLMVDSLKPKARSLLFLMGLFSQEQVPDGVPDELLKFLSKFILKTTDVRPLNDSYAKYLYDSHEKYLKDRSLVESRTEGNEKRLLVHGLRMHYIQEKVEDLRHIAFQIFPESIDQDTTELIHREDSEDTIAAIVGAIYFRKDVEDIVISTLERHFRIINDGALPQNINSGIEVLSFVRTYAKLECVQSLAWLLLNIDDGNGDWRREAHGYAKKIIIKLACHGKLDDCSMSGLLRLRETDTTALEVLEWVPREYPARDPDDDDPTTTFSHAHGKTMDAFFDLPSYLPSVRAFDNILQYETPATRESLGKRMNDYYCPWKRNPIFPVFWNDEIEDVYDPMFDPALQRPNTTTSYVTLEFSLNGSAL